MNSTLASVALTMLTPQLSPLHLMQLYRTVGNSADIVKEHDHLDNLLPDVSSRLKSIFSSLDTALKKAEEEIEFCEKHSIQILTPDNPAYPHRLDECDDAPLVLYYRGNADLNATKVINIIGTRHCTTYGQDLIRHFVGDMKKECPDTLIVSGLAYGVDIHAHRNALSNSMMTVGVLAHGLDMIYPATHRETAKTMVSQGGLLTEYPSKTRIEKRNFVQRNRIVAGMSDACILVESAKRGGGLITASISEGYHRDVFAFPGHVGAPYSEGCNNIIRDKQAQLITSAADFLLIKGWENTANTEQGRKNVIERQLFPDLTDEEKRIIEALQREGDMQTNMLTVRTGLSVSIITSSLFTLEMKGVVKPLAGGSYHLLD